MCFSIFVVPIGAPTEIYVKEKTSTSILIAWKVRKSIQVNNTNCNKCFERISFGCEESHLRHNPSEDQVDQVLRSLKVQCNHFNEISNIQIENLIFWAWHDSIGDNVINLIFQAPSWSALNGELRGYQIKHREVGGISDFKVLSLQSSAIEGRISNLQTFTAYEVIITSFNDQGQAFATPKYIWRTGETSELFCFNIFYLLTFPII